MSELCEQVTQNPKSPRLQDYSFLGSRLWLYEASYMYMSSPRKRKRQNLVNGSFDLVCRCSFSYVHIK